MYNQFKGVISSAHFPTNLSFFQEKYRNFFAEICFPNYVKLINFWENNYQIFFYHKAEEKPPGYLNEKSSISFTYYLTMVHMI